MFFRRHKSRENDLDREIRSHLELEAEEQQASGLSPEEAGYAARRALGNATLIKESTRAVWRWRFLEQLTQDLRHAGRTLRRSPGFAAIAVLSLALGIGANTAIFSLLDAVLLKSLPVSHPEQLRILMWDGDGSKLGMQSHSGYNLNGFDGSFSYPAYRTFRKSLPQFSALVAFANNQFTVSARGTSDLAFGNYVSGNYFSGLGAQAFLGRPIHPGDNAVAVLTYSYWSRRFHSDPAIVGRIIAINRLPVTVAGVMQPSFRGLMPGRAIDLFLPMSMVPETAASYYSLTKPDFWWVQIFGRLKPGVSVQTAATAVQAAFVHEIESYTGKKLPPSSQPKIGLRPGGRGVGLLRSFIGKEIWILAAIAAIVLLIACANLATLLLARYSARTRDIAVRLSIGAGRATLMRQMLTESMLLAIIGAAVGLLIAKPMLHLLVDFFSGTSFWIGTINARLDTRALAFAIAAAIVTALLFGLVPAWRATRVNLASDLKEAAVAAAGRRSRFALGRYLVPIQIAFVDRRRTFPAHPRQPCLGQSRLPNGPSPHLSDRSRKKRL